MIKAAWRRYLCCCLVAVLLAVSTEAPAERTAASVFTVDDSLGSLDDSSEDARRCLAGLAWRPTSFEVVSRPTPGEQYDRRLRFATPIPSGDADNDRVAVGWYAVQNGGAETSSRPAVIVVHETGSQMLAGRLFARGLRVKGVHAFMVELPFYGERRGQGVPDTADTITLFRQGVADIRRARDAVAALPEVDAGRISVQGTSLGGIAAALAASLDGAFEHTFLTLAGGDLYTLVQNGQREAGMFRRRLQQKGFTDEQLESLFWRIEPTRIAHRLDAATTWLYSARHDQVIPARHSAALARAAGLSESHQLTYPGDHYTAFLYFPKMLDHVVSKIDPR